ncbi:MAG: small GTP-binding protein [Chthoniobacteraceae bacterium]|nr:small GTP-binding protein [Chthoniobacteraceae bacterium]
MSERTVAIVGRPNVGKSALFNRLAGRKISIVHDQPGVTRDRIATKCKLGNAPFTIFDTGGIGSTVDASFTDQVHAEVDIAIATSDVLLFVVDGQAGLNPLDRELARQLRKVGKPVILVVNKIDVDQHAPNAVEFSQLGFENQIAISAEHNRAIEPLVAWAERLLPRAEFEPELSSQPVKIAIVGRPNVGKSSLTNAILKDKRTMVSEISGTTRDAIDIPYERQGNPYILIDTAGIRPRGKVSTSVEVFSVMRSESSIRRADLVLLVIDASVGVTAQDKKIAGLIQEARKPCVVAVNKWDLVKEQTDDKESLVAFMDEVRAQLFFLDYAPVLMASAKTGAEMTRIFKTIERIRIESHDHIGTGPLNRLLATAMTAHPSPLQSGRRFKVLYATQADARTRSPIPIPEIIFFCNDEKLLVETYRRFLESRIREKTPYTGLPLLFHLRAREVKGAEKKRPVRTKAAPEGEPKPVRVKKITHKPPTARRKALPARGMTGGRKGG